MMGDVYDKPHLDIAGIDSADSTGGCSIDSLELSMEATFSSGQGNSSVKTFQVHTLFAEHRTVLGLSKDCFAFSDFCAPKKSIASSNVKSKTQQKRIL